MEQSSSLPSPGQPQASVNPGICALLSFLWPGAGFFLMQRVGLAVTVIFSVIAFDLVVNFIGALMLGVGLICTIPMSIVVHVAAIIWTYQAAVAYNRRISPAPAKAPLASTLSPPAPTAVHAATAAAPAPALSYGSLECVGGSLAGRRFAVTRQGLLIGRDPAKCQIVVSGEGVSREHAWVVATDEGVVVIDRGSSNGTYVNSVDAGRVTKASLREGDHVLIGSRGAAFVYSRD
jgi:FHA domain